MPQDTFGNYVPGLESAGQVSSPISAGSAVKGVFSEADIPLGQDGKPSLAPASGVGILIDNTGRQWQYFNGQWQ